MGVVHDRMLDDLTLKNYSEKTAHEYLRCAGKFLDHFGCSPLKIGEEAIRKYVLELRKARRPPTVKMYVAAIRFLYALTAALM